MIYNIKKLNSFIFLMVSLFAFSTSSIADILRVPIGVTGYLGEVPSPIQQVTYTKQNNYRDIYPNHPWMELLNWKNGPGGGPDPRDFEYYAPEGAYGVLLVNERNPNSKIVLLINGNFLSQHNLFNTPGDIGSGYYTRTSSFRLQKSKMVSSDGMYHVPKEHNANGVLGFGINPSTGADTMMPAGVYSNALSTYTGYITSYSAYAITPIEKGRYLSNSRLMLQHRGPPGDGFAADERYTFLKQGQDIGIIGVDACKVIPLSNKSISYPAQLAGKYASPTMLSNRLAQISVSCGVGTKYFLSITPHNALLEQSYTGMVLSADTSQGTSDLPYISTALNSANNNTCAMNSSSAIDYTSSTQLTSLSNNNFVQDLNFLLCAYGDIKPGMYRGSMSVRILVE